MPSVGRYTHALISRVPASFQSLKTLDGACIDLERARLQQESLVNRLRDLEVDVLELPPDEDSPSSVFINDCAVILQGIALICRPGEDRLSDLATVRAVLRNQLSIKTVEMGSTTARLNASDVLFTGKEFFVAIGKETNTEGALVLANTWPEYPCTPVKVDGQRHLLDRITLAGPDVLSVSNGDNSQALLKRIEREAAHRYQTLTLPEEDASNCIFVNGTLIRVQASEAPESDKLFRGRVDYSQIPVSVSEFQKTGRGLSSVCLLFRKSKTIRAL